MARIMLIDPYFKEGLKGFPLGLAYIAGALAKNHEVLAIDLTAKSFIEKREWKEILKESLAEFRPEILCITSTSPAHASALEAARVIKKFGNIPIIKGGPHETNCAETTIRNNPEIDYSVIGEGEETIVELVDCVESGKNPEKVKGIVFRRKDRIVRTAPRPLIQNLDELPRPARNLFYLNEEYDRYYSAELFHGRESTSIMTSRGCPYKCSFCSSAINWRNMIRYRSVENAIEEIGDLHSSGFCGFMFEDDMSIANREWFLEFAKEIAKRGLGIQYTLQTRADAIDEEVAKALSESGCIYMYFGIESGVQEILDKCGKGITIAKAREAFRLARKYGIRSMASIQFGLPGEDLKNLSTVKETIKTLNEELKPDEVAVSYTCLYPGSPLAIKEGVIPEMYEKSLKTSADRNICKKTAHGTLSIHPKGLTSGKIMEIERLLEKELRIKRFEVNTFYKT